MCIGHAHISCSSDHQAQNPDGRDERTLNAVSEDSKVGERSNNNGTLDDRHGSQMPDTAQPKSVHPTVDKPHEATSLDVDNSLLSIIAD